MRSNQMTEFVNQDTAEYKGNEFKILYAGLPDGNDLRDLLDEDNVVRAPEGRKHYFAVSETRALNEYVVSRFIEPGAQPAVVEAWFPEDGDHLEEWSSETVFSTESYPIQNVRGYKDVDTWKFVKHGEGWQPETRIEEVKKLLGIEEPEYLFQQDTEFDPITEW